MLTLSSALTDLRPSTCACGATIEPLVHQTASGRTYGIVPGRCRDCFKARDEQEARREAVERGIEAMRRSGVPTRYLGYRFERLAKPEKGEAFHDFKARVEALRPRTLAITHGNARVAALLRDWKPTDGSVYVCGEVGGGKSTLVAALATRLCEEGTRIMYLAEGDLWRKTGEEYADVRAGEVPVLLWDDWSSTEKPHDWQKNMVEGIIMRRYAACLPIVMTSNAPLASAKKWGDRVASRLAEMVGPRHLELVDHDWRTGKAHGVRS